MLKNFSPRIKLSPQEWWEEFVAHTNEYKREWKNIFGEELQLPQKNHIGMLKKASRNFSRIPGDFLRLEKSHYKTQATADLEIDLEIEDRLLVLRAAMEDAITSENKRVYHELAANEVATEVNCRNIIRIRGLSLGQFYKIMSDSGCNIRPFFSEYKGENGGRWVMDNQVLPELIGETLDVEKDKYYLDRMFPNAPSWLPWSNWTNSRTHGVIYSVHGKNGKELIVPTHIDAENALVAIKEVVTGRKRREIGAIEYHQMPEGQGEAYVGSGLGELGCLVLIGIFENAQVKKRIKAVKIKGLEKLSTSGSIAGDDKYMWQLYRLAKGRVLK
jgi:hypothetical protein